MSPRRGRKGVVAVAAGVPGEPVGVVDGPVNGRGQDVAREDLALQVGAGEVHRVDDRQRAGGGEAGREDERSVETLDGSVWTGGPNPLAGHASVRWDRAAALAAAGGGAGQEVRWWQGRTSCRVPGRGVGTAGAVVGRVVCVLVFMRRTLFRRTDRT